MSIVKSSFYTILCQILSIASSFIALVLISRVLGPGGQGYYSLVSMIPKLAASLMSWGAPVAFIFYWNEKQHLRNYLISSFRKFYILLSVSTFLLASLFVFFTKGAFYEGIENYNLLKALAIIFLMFFNSYEGTKLQIQQRFKRLSLILVAQPISLVMLLAISFALNNLSVDRALSYFCLSHLLTALIFLFNRGITRLPLSVDDKQTVEKGFIWKVFQYSAFSHISSVAILLTYRMDVFFISKYLTPSDIGIYMVSVNIAERVWVISESVAKVMFAKLVTLNSHRERTLLSLKINRVSIILNLIIIFMIAVFSEPFINLFFGDRYQSSSLILLILLPGVFLSSIAKLMGNDIDAKGFPRLNSLIALFSLSFNFIMNLVFIPQYGIIGAGFATSITYCIHGVLSYVVYVKVSRIGLLEIFKFRKSDFEFLQKAWRRS